MFARRGREDAWSSSAWDDDGWDDDFSDRSRRASIRPAADPKPEAVDAWLTSDKDDFDDITRDIAVKWSGKEPSAAQTLPAGATWDDPIDPPEGQALGAESLLADPLEADDLASDDFASDASYTSAPETSTVEADSSFPLADASTPSIADDISAPDLLQAPDDLPAVDDLDENPAEDFSAEEILAEEASIDSLPTEFHAAEVQGDEAPEDAMQDAEIVSHEALAADVADFAPGDGFMKWDSAASAPSDPVVDEAPAPEFHDEPDPATAQLSFDAVTGGSLDAPTDSEPTDSEPTVSSSAEFVSAVATSVEPPVAAVHEVIGPDGERDLFLEDLYAELEDVPPSKHASAHSTTHGDPVPAAPPVSADASVHEPEPPVSTEQPLRAEPEFATESDLDADFSDLAVAPDEPLSDAVPEPAYEIDSVTTTDFLSPQPADDDLEADDDATQLLDIADIPVSPTKPGATFEVADDFPEFAPDFSPPPRPRWKPRPNQKTKPKHPRKSAPRTIRCLPTNSTTPGPPTKPPPTKPPPPKPPPTKPSTSPTTAMTTRSRL